MFQETLILRYNAQGKKKGLDRNLQRSGCYINKIHFRMLLNSLFCGLENKFVELVKQVRYFFASFHEFSRVVHHYWPNSKSR